MLAVGIPKEIKSNEKRVGLTPRGVAQLTEKKIPVFIQEGAGELSGYSNEDYARSGAVLTESIEELYKNSIIIKKVKEPLSREYSLIKSRHILFSFLHLASQEQCELVKALLSSKCTAIAYETVEKDDKTPILAPMSEIAGALSITYAALFQKMRLLENNEDSSAEITPLMESLAHIYPASTSDLKVSDVIIFGGGKAGEKAAELGLKMGGMISIVEANQKRMEKLSEIYNSKIKLFHHTDDLSQPLKNADILIGSVHTAGHRAIQVMNMDQLKKASAFKNKIIMDIAIDQGGNFPESHTTSYDNPLYKDSLGNLRFSVANIPSFCGPYASKSLSDITVEYTAALAINTDEAIKNYSELSAGVNIMNGHILNKSIAEAHEIHD